MYKINAIVINNSLLNRHGHSGTYTNRLLNFYLTHIAAKNRLNVKESALLVKESSVELFKNFLCIENQGSVFKRAL